MFVEADESEARAILGAMRAVTRAAGAPSGAGGIGDALVAAAGRIAFRPPLVVEPEALGRPEPGEIARALGARPLREAAARLIATASLVDGELDPRRLEAAVAYARALDVDEDWVRQLLETARGHLDWVKADMMRRNVRTFPGLGTDDGRAVEFFPYTGSAADRALAERFRALAGLGEATFGRLFFAQFERHGFRLPGEPGAFHAAFSVPHDALHVLSGYDTSVPGELLVSTFTGAMHGAAGMGAHILPVIYEWHVGVALSPAVPAAHGSLVPEKFWVAWDRGARASRDVLDPAWDFWAWAGRPVAEVRAAHGIEPLEPRLAP